MKSRKSLLILMSIALMATIGALAQTLPGLTLGSVDSTAAPTAPGSIPDAVSGTGLQGQKQRPSGVSRGRDTQTIPGAPEGDQVSAGPSDSVLRKTDESASESPAPAKSETGPEIPDALPALVEGGFQRYIKESTGQTVPLFGYGLFGGRRSTFAPSDNIAATPDYAVGSSDEILIRVWGSVEIEAQVTVDRAGQINLPKVGTFSVNGIRVGELENYIRSKIGRIYKGFDLNVSMGKLRPIQIYVVGHARRAGSYYVSGLSSLVHGLFASGGPSANGSMRHILLKRRGVQIADLDLYEFLLRGAKNADVRLQAGDVIVIPPAGPRVALLGATTQEAIFELDGSKRNVLKDLIDLIGGKFEVTTSALLAGLERIDPSRTPSRLIAQISLDDAGLATALKDGDIVTLYPIGSRFENLVVLERHGAPNIRLPWRAGMRIKDLLERDAILTDAYWKRVMKGRTLSGPRTFEVNWEYATLQRLETHELKTELRSFRLDLALAGNAQENMELQPGDIINIYGVDEVPPQAQDSVALGGSVFGQTQRFTWRPNMTVKDILRDEKWLNERYQLFRKRGLEQGGGITVPASFVLNWEYATIHRLDNRYIKADLIAFRLDRALDGDPIENLKINPGDIITLYGADDEIPEAKDSIYINGSVFKRAIRFPWRKNVTVKDILRDEKWLTGRYDYWNKVTGSDSKVRINWDYASITRRSEENLTKNMDSFNLWRALKEPGSKDNITLQPGDAITLYTSQDISLPQSRRARVVTVEGEVGAAGAYQLKDGETLRQLLLRAGGVTQQAYVYGTVFTRDSIRRQQQERLEKAIRLYEDRLLTEEAAEAANAAASSNINAADAQIAAVKIRHQREQLSRLKTQKAMGRLALELSVEAKGVIDLPDVPMEDGDRIFVPNRNHFVMAVGAVHNDNSILWREGRTVGEALEVAGLSEDADEDNAFLVRADGTVISRSNRSGLFSSMFNSFSSIELMPGDVVVMPDKIQKATFWTTFVSGLKDWSQILYQFGLGVAAWKNLK